MDRKIKVEQRGTNTVWICECGNHTYADGFYPCDDKGKKHGLYMADWDNISVVCERCGVIINQETKEIIGEITRH